MTKRQGTVLCLATIPRVGAAKTTIGEVNATGILYAKKDGRNHVSVHPRGGTLEEWKKAGSSSIWTTTLMSIVVIWDSR